MTEPLIIDRKGWKAKRPTGDYSSTAHSFALIVHHEGTREPFEGDDDDAATAVRAVQAFHQGPHGVNGEPSKDIEYNWLLSPITGTLFEGRGWKGRNAANGIGNPELGNEHTKSVAVLGNTNLQTLSVAAKRSLQWLAAAHSFMFGETRLYGHRDVNPDTACPGEDAYAFVQSGFWLPADAEDPAPPAADTDLDTEELMPMLRTLRQGDEGLQVRNLQGLLNVRGAGVEVNGRFGPETADAIEKFLKDRQLHSLDGTYVRDAEGWVWTALLTREDG